MAPAQPKPTSASAPAKASATQTASAGTAAIASGAKYTVQVGAFKSRENAEALLTKIQKTYPDGRIFAAAGSVFRVVSGAFASKGDADSRARTLAASGYTTFVRDMPN
jgi:cell division protein FtsN